MKTIQKYRLFFAGACLLTITPGALAYAQGQMYLFGGSQLDNGNDARLGYMEPESDGIHFMNGRTYGEYLPGELGLNFKASNGYAYGGATSGTVNIVGTLAGQGPAFLGLQPQITAAADAGVKFAPADLIAINAAQDDYINAMFTQGATTAAALEAVSGTIASNLGTAVTRLNAMGGQRFSVATPWDYYQSPDHGGLFSADITPAVSAAVTQITAEMQAVHNRTGADIVVYNAELAFRQFAANPAAYGFSNVTDGCSTATGGGNCADGKSTNYLFFNGQHTATYANQIIAEQIANLETAPAYAATGVQLLASNTELFDQAIRQHFDAAPPSSGGLTVFVLGLGGNGSNTTLTNDRGVAAFGEDYGIAGGAVGVEASPEPGLTTGILAGATSLHGSANGENLDGHASEVGLFLSYNTGPWRMDADAAYSWDAFGQISRPGVRMGNLYASPNGHGASVTGQISRGFDMGTASLRPLAALSYQESSLDGYSEQGDPLLAQEVDSTRIVDFFGDAGAALELPMLTSTLPLSSALTLEVEHDFLGSGFTVNSAALSAPVWRSDDVPDSGRTYGRVGLAVAFPVTATVTASGSLSTTFARDDGNQHEVWVKLAYAF